MDKCHAAISDFIGRDSTRNGPGLAMDFTATVGALAGGHSCRAGKFQFPFSADDRTGDFSCLVTDSVVAAEMNFPKNPFFHSAVTASYFPCDQCLLGED